MPKSVPRRSLVSDEDRRQMAELAAWTAGALGTPRQTPFGAAVVATADGTPLLRRLNAVAAEHDPSSHAEVRVLRAACKRLRATRLAGYTLYTTCEPCPMCMSMALWAGIDRVVYGATIADAARHCAQIYVPARTVARRSDMDCRVDGPVGRSACVALFEDPRQQAAMKLWPKAKARAKPR
ncbi:MAG: nucleoside deaminase [Verrucomicrobiota bacterium]